jgi:hypothetical protein
VDDEGRVTLTTAQVKRLLLGLSVIVSVVILMAIAIKATQPRAEEPTWPVVPESSGAVALEQSSGSKTARDAERDRGIEILLGGGAMSTTTRTR